MRAALKVFNVRCYLLLIYNFEILRSRVLIVQQTSEFVCINYLVSTVNYFMTVINMGCYENKFN